MWHPSWNASGWRCDRVSVGTRPARPVTVLFLVVSPTLSIGRQAIYCDGRALMLTYDHSALSTRTSLQGRLFNFKRNRIQWRANPESTVLSQMSTNILCKRGPVTDLLYRRVLHACPRILLSPSLGLAWGTGSTVRRLAMPQTMTSEQHAARGEAHGA